MEDIDYKIARQQRSIRATEQQRMASNPMRSVWVEASAGTGKTKVLSDRVLRILLKGVSPAKILCLTYTKAAAVEMSSRIAQRLSEWAVISDTELDKQLEKLLGKLSKNRSEYLYLTAMARKLFAVLLDTPGGMKIQTIHSFCQEILKRFPLEAQISPYFEVIDDRAKKEILGKIQTKMLSGEENENSAVAWAVGYLTSHVSEFSFPDVMSSITDNASKIIKLFNKYTEESSLFNELAVRLGVNPDYSEEQLKSSLLSSLNRDVLRKMMNAWFQGTATDIKKAEVIAEILEKEQNVDIYALLRSVFLTQKGELLARYATKKVLELYSELSDEAHRIANTLIEIENKLTGLRVYTSTKAIIILARELIGNYLEYKKVNAKMDYDD